MPCFGGLSVGEMPDFVYICGEWCFFCMLKELYLDDGRIECGVDEAGRGCLAGSVYAAAVILPRGYRNALLNDSKQLSERQRTLLRAEIEREAVAWAVGEATPEEIDRLNILRASHLAMHRAIGGLSTAPERLLIDGNRFAPYAETPHYCIVKGDARYLSIAAASVLAKTHRDEAMTRLAELYPQYGWDRHKGYPTPAHRRAIAEHGASPLHRHSFRLLDEPTLFD